MQSKHRSFSSQLLPSSEQYFPFPLGAGFWQYLIRLRMHFLVFGTGSQSDHCSHAPQLPSEFHIYNEKRRDCHHFIMLWLNVFYFLRFTLWKSYGNYLCRFACRKNALSIHQNKCIQKVCYNSRSDNHASSYIVSNLPPRIHPCSCTVQDAGSIPMFWRKCSSDVITH